MADTLEQLTKKLLDEQVAANKKEAADRQLQKIKDTNEINKQNKILEELDTKLIENLQEQLKNADKKDKELIESLGKQLKDAGVDKFMEATSRIESIEESQKFSKKVEAERSKDVKRIDAMKTSVERMKDEAIASGKDASKDRVIKDAEVKIRKEEFALRVKNLEGTDRQAAFLEELGNDLKDKGLDPEKNKKFQKATLELQKAELRERLKNAETPSERIEILKEQSSKDRKALSLSQKTLLGINNIGVSLKEGFKGFGKDALSTGMGLLKKAALIGLLLMLPKILNSQTAKDFVKYMEDTGIPAIKNFFKNMLNFFKGISEGGFGYLLGSVGRNLKSVFDPDEPTSFIGLLLTATAGLLALKTLGILKAITGFVLAVTGVKKLFNKMTGKIDPTKVPKDATATTTTKAPKTGLGAVGEDKKLSKAALKKEGLAVNKGGRIVDTKTGKFASKEQIAAAGKLYPKYAKVAKIANKLGPIGKIVTGGLLVSQLLSGKSPAELAPQIAGLFTGLIGVSLGAAGGAALGSLFFPVLGTGIGGLVGGLLGGFGGDMIGTALAEYMLGLPLTGAIGKLGNMGGKGTTSGASLRKKSRRGGGQTDGGTSGADAIPAENISPTVGDSYGDAATVTPTGGGGSGEGQIIQANIIDNSKKSSSSSYTSGGTITPLSYGMTSSVINSV